MSDTNSDIADTDFESTQITEDGKPKKLGKLKKPKVVKVLSETDEEDGETIYSEERSDDDESIGSLVDFIVHESSSSPKSPKLEDMEEDETNLLIQDAKVFLGDENLELNSKIKNGRVLRGNPKTTETQRQYWTRRIVYLQCLDDLSSKAWKTRAKEIGIPNLKHNIPERVDVNGNINNDKWDEFTNFYNDLKEKLFGEDTESSCDEDDDDFSESDELENDDDDEDEEDEDDEEDVSDDDESDEEEEESEEKEESENEKENNENDKDENKVENVLSENEEDDDIHVYKKPKLN
jgi:hypothetical protein